MKQMIKETAPEVKREIPAKSLKKDRVHRYTKRDLREVGTDLKHRSQEECLAILSRVDEFQRFPGSLMTNLYEAARFYGIDQDKLRERLSKQIYIVYSPDNKAEFPILRVKDVARQIAVKAPDSKFLIMEKVLFVGNKETAMRIGYSSTNHYVRMLSPKGMIILAYALVNGISEDNRRVAKLVVDECERSGIFEKEAPPVQSEPIPAEPTPEPAKMDYAETLRKLFDSVLTLVEKQAEERGAEKIIQQLKETGKL